MSVKLNKKAFDHAKKLIREEAVVIDERDAWSEHQPTTEEENAFIEKHGWGEYAKWHLGIDEEESEQTKGRYKFPYGDFKKVHRCGVISAESRAGQFKYEEIKHAASQLLERIDALATHH